MRKLFLDDLRMPEEVTWIRLHDGPYDIVRTFDEFTAYIEEHGVPSVISFDNDLGEDEPEGRDCAKWLVEQVLDGKIEMNENLQFTVHSKNIVAGPWIQQYLDQFIAIWK